MFLCSGVIIDAGAPGMDDELLFRFLFIAIYGVFFGVRIRHERA
jgi:hypothetical protein